MLNDGLPFDDLSAYLDQELPEPQIEEVQNCLGEHFPALVDVRNMESLSRACKNLATPTMDFESGIFARLDALGWEQEDPSEDFENLSAFSDSEWAPETPDFSETAQTHLHNFTVLSQAIQALPTPTDFSSDFVTRVMSALPDSSEPEIQSESPHFDVLSRALQALPVPEASERFLSALEARLDQVDAVSAQNEKVLGHALQALPVPEASESFFTALEARLDQADILVFPQPEEVQVRKQKVFAIPMFLRGRYARMVAGIAFFGLLVSFSQHMLDTQTSSTQEAGISAVVPTDHVIQLENQPEDILFSNSDDSLDNLSVDDYTNLIGG